MISTSLSAPAERQSANLRVGKNCRPLRASGPNHA
jgi:hypothetical protein